MRPGHMAAILPRTREKWLSKTVCVLAGAFDIKAKWVESGPAPSWWDGSKRTVTLNASDPKAADMADEHAYAKGKLYHELAHVLFTGDRTLDVILATAGVSPFSEAISLLNILEDGRIERKLAEILPGCDRYIRYVLRAFGKPNDDWSDLVARVRVRGDYKYLLPNSTWIKVDGLIQQAMVAGSIDDVAVIVGKIIAQMPVMPANPQSGCYVKPGKGAKSDSQGVGKNSRTPGDKGDNKGKGDKADGSTSGDASDDASDEQDDASDSASDSSSDSGQTGNGEGRGKRTGQQQTPEDQQAADDKAKVRADAKKELEAMAAEDVEPETQEFDIQGEADTAETIRQYIDSLRFEATKENWSPCRTGGRIDASRIIGAMTGDSYRLDMEPASGFEFATVVCVDASGSMDSDPSGEYRGVYSPTKIRIATTAARVINGGLQAAKLESSVVVFSTHAQAYPQIPTSIRSTMDLPYMGGCTDGQTAIDMAADILRKSAVDRRLIVMITDGQYRSRIGMLAELEAAGIYVVRICIGAEADAMTVHPKNPEYWPVNACHQEVSLVSEDDIRALPQVLESVIMTFAQQTA